MSATRNVLIVSMGPSGSDYEIEVSFLGRRVHVQRIGCNGRMRKARFLIEQYDGKVDAIGLGGMSLLFKMGERSWHHRETYRIAQYARRTPVVGGRRFKAMVEGYAVRKLAHQFPELFRHETILFMSGITSYEMSQVLSEYSQNISFADPVLHFGVPYVLESTQALKLYTRAAMTSLQNRPYRSFYPERSGHPWRSRLLAEAFERAEIIIGDHTVLNAYLPEKLRHKIIVSNTLSDQDREIMKKRGVRMLVGTIPQVFERPLGSNVLEAMTVTVLDKPEGTDADFANVIDRLKLKPEIVYPQGRMIEKRKFAFLVHPVRQKTIFSPPSLQPLKLLPPRVRRVLEWGAAELPPLHYSKVEGIRSEANGIELEGWIIAIGATPKELARRGPQYARARVVEASKLAARLGARIMGLGAFSKTLGYAGGSISQRTWLPITTGNSYAASMMLWAVNDACRMMGLPRDREGRIQGSAMIVGSLSPAGEVAARLLTLIVPELILADTDANRLWTQRALVEEEGRPCNLSATLDPRGELPRMDLVIMMDYQRFHFTREDVNLFKAGAIFCDAAEPPALPEKLTEVRPDILVLRSGAVEMPGPVVYSRNIGAAPKTGYASMAEAAILVLEGRFEPFSTGADVDMDRVREIYKLGLKHGFKLAGVEGPHGVYTESEIALKRTLAGEARRSVLEQQKQPKRKEVTGVRGGAKKRSGRGGSAETVKATGGTGRKTGRKKSRGGRAGEKSK